MSQNKIFSSWFAVLSVRPGFLAGVLVVVIVAFAFGVNSFLSSQTGLRQSALRASLVQPDSSSPEAKSQHSFGNLSSITKEEIFIDVSSRHKYAKAIAFLKARKIMGAKTGKAFKPEQPLQRSEFLQYLLLASNDHPTTVTYRNCFLDVHEESYAAAVCYAKSKGWVQGMTSRLFHPTENLTQGDALRIFQNVLKNDTKTFAALQKVMKKGNNIQVVTRAYGAQLLYLFIQR